MKTALAVLLGLSISPAFAAWHFDTLSEPPAKQISIDLPYQQIHKNITHALNKCTKGFDIVNGVIYSDLGESEIVFHNKGNTAVAQAVYRLTRVQAESTRVEAWSTPTIFGSGPVHLAQSVEKLALLGGEIDCREAGF